MTKILQKLIDAQLASVSFIAGDGHPALSLRSNKEAAQLALQIILKELSDEISEHAEKMREDFDYKGLDIGIEYIHGIEYVSEWLEFYEQ